MGAPSNGSKTAHSKVANGTNAGTSGSTATSQATTTSKRSSSSADGDYQLVQHEVLYSQSSQYEVSFLLKQNFAWFALLCIFENVKSTHKLNVRFIQFFFVFEGWELSFRHFQNRRI
jgi:hypothetical protein